MRKWLLAAAGIIALGVSGAQAQNYPARTITMLIPFAAGGPTDTVGRLIAESMTKTLGQQIVIENAAGAGGTRAPGLLVKAAPDGYTILLHHIGMSTAPTLYRKLAYKPLEDFEYIGLVTDAPMSLIARPNFEAKDFKGVLEYIAKTKEKTSYANAGIGSASHLCGMLFQAAVKQQLNTVNYNGTGPAMNDVLGGHVDLMCDQTTNTTGQIKGGKVKAYGVTTKARVKNLPDIPTLDEAGLKGFEVAVWHGVYAPKGTPKDVLDKLEKALQAALKDPKVISAFADLGTEPVPQNQATGAALKAKLAAEIAKWKPLIEAAGQFAD
ncbi:MAG: tripartite tricarboxylate transporter substrate binding protein BugD [Xanthobacteraceae bacterium]|nr:tripartite tricarboxylate transporter substrate binding protein BugD [Xanthobacteraceae bacterium]QYK44222.1 MAG: tripartite tricarboxylate transporter substrate binding protein BugD [Xanthobacteraceae bacterium]